MFQERDKRVMELEAKLQALNDAINKGGIASIANNEAQNQVYLLTHKTSNLVTIRT